MNGTVDTCMLGCVLETPTRTIAVLWLLVKSFLRVPFNRGDADVLAKLQLSWLQDGVFYKLMKNVNRFLIKIKNLEYQSNNH